MGQGQLSVSQKLKRDRNKHKKARHGYYLLNRERIVERNRKCQERMTRRYRQNLRKVYDDPESLLFGVSKEVKKHDNEMGNES